MATVIFYNSILFVSTFFVWLSEKSKGRLERYFFLGLAFVLVFLPSAIRYDIGTDYVNYLRIYETGSYINYQFKEPAFYFINWFLDSIDAHYQWLFAIFSFIFTTVVFKAYPGRNAWLLHFLFFSMLWFFSFNGIRQAIALSFCLLALFDFFDKRYLWFFALTIIGSLFHQSALIITVVGALALIPLPIQFKNRVAPLAFIAVIGVAFFSMSIVLVYMEQVLNLLGMTKYAGYFNNTRHFIHRDFGSGLGVLSKVLFSIYIIINAKAYLQQNKQYWLLIVLVFAYALGLVLANSIIIFGRMADVFVIAQILGIYFLWSLPRNRKINKLVIAGFIAFLILSFIKDGMGVETSYADPKRNPYQTVFEVTN